MTDSFQGGSFDPVDSEDYVAPLQTAYKDINAGMDNYWSQELRNAKYAAIDAGTGMEALANMSDSISGVLKKREEEQRKEDYAKGYMWLYENGLPKIDQDNYKAGVETLKEEGSEINKLRYAHEAQGGDIWTSVEFKKLNKAEQHGAVVAWVESKLDQYNPSTNPELKNATSYEEYKAAESKYRLQLYKSLGDINPALVNEHLFDGQRKKEQAAYNSWYATRETEIKTQEKVEANRNLLSCVKAGADNVHCLNNYVGSYEGLYGGKGAARRAGLEEIKTLAEKGVLKEGQIDDLLDKKYIHADGHETTYREQFEKEVADIEDALIDHATNEQLRKDNQDKLDAIADTDAFLKTLDPNQITENGYRLEAQQKLRDEQERQTLKYRGHSDPYLKTAIDTLSLEKNKIKEYQNKFDIAYRDGNMTSEILKTYPIQIQLQDENKLKAQQGDTVISGAKQFHEMLENMVKKESTMMPGGWDDGAVSLTSYFQARWKKRAVEMIGSLPPEEKHKAGQMAFDELKLEFDTAIKKGSGHKENPFQDVSGNLISPNSYTVEEVIHNAKGIDEAIRKENQYIKLLGGESLTSPRLFFSEQELINMQNESAERGSFVIPEKAKRIAKKFDSINAIDVINLQRKAIGMEPLSSDSLKLFEGLPTESQFLLNYSATSITTARAWGTYGGPITGISDSVAALRPDGKDILKLAETYKIPPGHILAGTELAEELELEGVVLDFTKPINPQLTRDQKRAYARLLYKYGDKEIKINALEDLRFDPRPRWSSKRYKNYNEYRADVLAWKERNTKELNKEEIETYQNKISHLDPKNRNVPNTDELNE